MVGILVEALKELLMQFQMRWGRQSSRIGMIIMSKKSLFNASFEESLNIKDDGFLQFQKKNYYNKLGKVFRKGRPSFWFTI